MGNTQQLCLWRCTQIADTVYGQTQDEMEPGLEDESRVSLIKATADAASSTWVYDYGDYWEHKIKVECIVDLGVPLSR